MQNYLDLLQTLLDEGVQLPDRTGTGSLNLFGYQMRFDLAKGFPLLTTKKVHLKSVIHELLWFLNGDTNVGYLRKHGVSIWDEWADPHGDLGPVYGKQWRDWGGERDCVGVETRRGTDQIKDVIEQLGKDPYSRRAVVSAWNVSDLGKMALMPCHCLFQFFVLGNRLCCQLYQRSADVFLGVPFNIASYAALTHIIAQQTGLVPGTFVWTGGVVHLYQNHLDQARLQLTRAPKKPPVLLLKRKPAVDKYRYEDFVIENYDPHPAIKAPVAV